MALTGWSSANYLSRDEDIQALPYFVSAWIKTPQGVVHKTIFTKGLIANWGSNANSTRVLAANDNTRIWVAEYDDAGNPVGNAQVAAAYANDTWEHVSAAFISTVLREVRDAAQFNSNATSATLTTPTRSSVGRDQAGTRPFGNTDGLAEVSIWDVTGFTQTDRDNLDSQLRTLVGGTSALNPLVIDAQSAVAWTGKLVAYWPLITSTDLADKKSTHNLTMQGTITNYATHPPVDPPPSAGLPSIGAIFVIPVARSM